MSISTQAHLIELAARTTVRPVLDVYGRVLHLPIPWPYKYLSKALEWQIRSLPGVERTVTHLAGTRTSVFTPANPDPDTAILYLHGGGLLVCSPGTHRRFIAHLAQGIGAQAYAPAYPMLTDATPGEIIRHLLPVYRALRAQYRNVIVAGDSAGGYLTLAITAAARRAGLSDPTVLLLVSPTINLDTRTTVNAYTARGGSDPLFPASAMRTMAHSARRRGTRKHELRVDFDALVESPLPPTALSYAGREMLSVDAEFLEQTFDSITSMRHGEMSLHVYPVLCEMMPESMRAISELSDFARDHCVSSDFAQVG